ncbi:hypothetical protein, partial [Pseudomonas sp. DP16D-R1]|uniref:hypothetical protein n=1 Tax=Pseudomonas sp. DP16D-R1 TaxID=2075551 RepID=UPI000CD38216
MSWKRQNEEFWLALDHEIVQFFGKHELAHIDFQARLELKAPLAKWLLHDMPERLRLSIPVLLRSAAGAS